MGFGHSHDACFITLQNDSRLTIKPRIRERNTRNENLKHVDFCTACYEKKFISCNPRLSLNPNLTCVVSLYAKNFFNPITYFLPPGIIALERCQGRFDIFHMFACKSPGIFVYGRGWLGIFLINKKKSCACTDLNNFIIFFTLWKLLLREYIWKGTIQQLISLKKERPYSVYVTANILDKRTRTNFLVRLNT